MAIFLEIEDIDGSVTAAGHEDWIEVDSLQWGVGRAIASGIGTAADRESSKPSISEISLSKMMDASSPLIFTEACVGVSQLVTIHLCKTGEEDLETYMEYELTNCMISGYSVSSGGDRPTETISLSFTQMVMTYTPSDSEGAGGDPIPAGYDMELGTKV